MLATLRANLLATVLGLAAVIFAVIAIVQSVEINGFLWIDGLKDKIEDCERDRNELRDISSKRNEQAKRTEGNIEQAERGNKEADDRARKIEEAPLPGNCKTPPEIIGADI
jgi:hypothetical protein